MAQNGPDSADRHPVSSHQRRSTARPKGSSAIVALRRSGNQEAAKGPDGRAGTDLAWLVVACSVLAALAMKFQVIDRVVDWSKAFDTFNLNGVMALFLLVPVAATLFSYRRYQDAMSVRGELARLSLHDTLTGLPNRMLLHRWLLTEMERSRRTNSMVGVMFIDLDRFKLVNDTYGHEVGDELMIAVARRLREGLRPDDRIVRYGGDEFVVICPNIPNAITVERIALRLIEALEAPFTIGTDTMRISTSIGIALTDDPEVDPEDIVREADVAMYMSKSNGVGHYTVFDPNAHGNVLAPLSAETRLREALANQEFRLYYQPVVNMETGEIAGVEALLRWLDPERGVVPPSEFIPVLEDSGLIVPVGTWVLTEACHQLKRWRTEFPDIAFSVTLNVSARQLAQADFGEVVTRALRESGAPHDLICLEITESSLMFDVSSAWAALRQAKSLGVSLALDDFGTGYSSLSYIRRFSLDMLKIDRSFVDGLGESLEDTAIVEHVIGMAKALGMVTVAEGVERPEQLRELRRLGCDLAQGYVFSRPVPVAEVDQLLADTARKRAWRNMIEQASGAPTDPQPRPGAEAHPVQPLFGSSPLPAQPSPGPTRWATPMVPSDHNPNRRADGNGGPNAGPGALAESATAVIPPGRIDGPTAPVRASETGPVRLAPVADDVPPMPGLPRLREFRPTEKESVGPST